MPQIAAAPASNYEHDHLPTDGKEAVARLQYFPEDEQPERPLGAEADVEERFAALQQTDFRLQAELNDLRSSNERLQRDRIDHGLMLSEINGRLRATEEAIAMLEASQAPRSDLYRRLTSRKFLMALVAFIGAIVGGLSGWIPTEVAAVLATASAGLYGLAEAWVDNGTEKARAEVAKAEGVKAAASLRPPA